MRIYLSYCTIVEMCTVNERKNVLLLHDNVRWHTAKITRNKIKIKIARVEMLELEWFVLSLPTISINFSKTLWQVKHPLIKTGFRRSSKTSSHKSLFNFDQNILISGNKLLKITVNIWLNKCKCILFFEE